MRIDAIVPARIHPIFLNIARSVSDALKDLGFISDVVRYDGQKLECDYGVIVGADKFKHALWNRDKNVKLIYWQQENLPRLNEENSERSMRRLVEFQKIYYREKFDYLWAGQKGQAIYMVAHDIFPHGIVRGGFSSRLVSVQPAKNKETDILFFGGITDRRKEIISKIPGTIWRELYNEELSELLGKTKIVLNIHGYDKKCFEVMRIVSAIAHQCLVISETIDYPEPLVSGAHLIICKPGEMPEKVKYYLAHEEERIIIAQEGFKFVTRHFLLKDEMIKALRGLGIDI